MSTTLTDEQKAQLQSDYAELKSSIAAIDNKYSLSYIEVDLEFPSTLGLERLTFTPKTDEELQALAETQIAARYIEKKRVLEKSYQASLADITYSQSRQSEQHRKKLEELAGEYRHDVDELTHGLVNNGLLYSSIKTSALADALSAYNDKVSEATTQNDAELDALSAKSEALTETYQNNLAALETQQTAECEQVVQELAEADQKQQLSVEKYNASIDEKEVKYQVSCKKALQSAIQAEYERGLQAARLYAELGESGVAQQVLAEKLVCCKSAFRSYTQTEAEYILGLDSFLQTNLESSYSTFTEWISATLLP